MGDCTGLERWNCWRGIQGLDPWLKTLRLGIFNTTVKCVIRSSCLVEVTLGNVTPYQSHPRNVTPFGSHDHLLRGAVVEERRRGGEKHGRAEGDGSGRWRVCLLVATRSRDGVNGKVCTWRPRSVVHRTVLLSTPRIQYQKLTFRDSGKVDPSSVYSQSVCVCVCV